MGLNFDITEIFSENDRMIQIPIDCLESYHNHRFELYTGERLEDMVESIRENGILAPIIVQPCGKERYEILSGHNRVNAARIVGLHMIPSVVKEKLTAEEAEMYVVETNLMQRGFDNLRVSEQAAVIAQRHSSMFSQGKRNDIIRELQMLDETADSTFRPVGEKLNAGEAIGKEYSMSSRNISRLLRVDKLTDKLKELVDNGSLAIRSGVELSYLSENTQDMLADLTDDYSIDIKKAKQLRSAADASGNIGNADIIRILGGKLDSVPKAQSIKISQDVFSRYFSPEMKKKEISQTIEKALELYFRQNGGHNDGAE